MPKTKKPQPQVTPQSVRDMIPSVTKLQRHLAEHGHVLSANAIYRWIKVDRVPGKYLVELAKFYDIEIPMHLAQSDIRAKAQVVIKPPETLPALLKVYRKELSAEQAAAQLGISIRSVNLALTNWGNELPLLVRTIQAMSNYEISVDEAAAALGVTKAHVHTIRRKYGLKPKRGQKPAPRPIHARRERQEEVVLALVEGKYTLGSAAEALGQSWRTVHRVISKLSPEHSLIELTHWPKSFRKAYADEIRHDLPRIVSKLFDFAKNQGILLKKLPKYPEIPENWRKASVKRMLVAVLSGEESLEILAVKRGADPKVLANLFTSDLRVLGLTFEEVIGRPVSFQIAVAELVMSVEDRKRRQT